MYLFFHLFRDKKFTSLQTLYRWECYLVVFEQWLEKKLKQYFNPIADIILADKQKLSSKKLINASFGEEVTTEVNDETNIQSNNLYQNTSKQSIRSLKCWICEQSHHLMQCSSFIDKTAPERN